MSSMTVEYTRSPHVTKIQRKGVLGAILEAKTLVPPF